MRALHLDFVHKLSAFFSGSMQNSGTSGKKRDCPAKSGMVGRFVDRRDQVNVCVFSLTEMVHRREASCLLGIRVILHSSLPHRRNAELRPQVHDTDRPSRLRLPGRWSHWCTIRTGHSCVT